MAEGTVISSDGTVWTADDFARSSLATAVTQHEFVEVLCGRWGVEGLDRIEELLALRDDPPRTWSEGDSL